MTFHKATVGPFLVVHNVDKAYYSQNIKNQNENNQN